jgi:Cu/Ag efflux protein CusF
MSFESPVNLRALLAAVWLFALHPMIAGRAEDTVYRYPFAAGTIEKLDPHTRRIVLDTTQGQQVMIVTDRTYLFRGKEKLTFDKLKVGESVKINYYTNQTGQAFIRRLKVDLPSPPEEPAAP